MTELSLEASTKNHKAKLSAIARALEAVEKALGLTYNQFLTHAAEQLRLALLQENKDFEVLEKYIEDQNK